MVEHAVRDPADRRTHIERINGARTLASEPPIPDPPLDADEASEPVEPVATVEGEA